MAGSFGQRGAGPARESSGSPAGASDLRARLLAAHEAAARFYWVQLGRADAKGPLAFLRREGVRVDGPWVVGYAPDRPTALVDELGGRGFSDRELLASGLASGKAGQLVDRFRDRVMVGVRDFGTNGAPIVAFVGYAPPGATADRTAIVYSPATAIYRPGTMLFGVAEQQERVGGASIVASDPLEAIAIASHTASDQTPPLVVAPGEPDLTSKHVAALKRVADLAAGVTVIVRPGEPGRRVAVRAYALLSPAVAGKSGRRGKLLVVGASGGLGKVRPLVELALREHLLRAARSTRSVAEREAAADAARAMISGESAQTRARLEQLMRGSMDSWQAGLLASKAEGLRDVQRPDLSDESDVVQEIGAIEWDYATMQAEISGNPYMGQLMQARLQLAGLEADRRNQAADRLRQAELLVRKQEEVEATRDAIVRRDEAIPRIGSVRGVNFAIRIGDRIYEERKDAGAGLRGAVTARLIEQRKPGVGEWQILGRCGGLEFGVRPELTARSELLAHVGFPELRHSEATYAVKDLGDEKVGATMVSRLVTALEKAPEHQALDRDRVPRLEAEIDLLTQQRSAIDFSERIEHARRRVELLDDTVGAIAERDKFPELHADNLDPDKYPTPRQRHDAIVARAEQRAPLQARVDQAVERLEAYDREHAAAASGLESEQVDQLSVERGSIPSAEAAAEAARQGSGFEM